MKLLVICRRELYAFFASFIAYILAAVFLLLSGYFFYSDLVFFILFGGFVLPSGLWQFVFLDMRLVTMLVVPLITMRLFAEEKKLGTMELMWTYPVRDGEIVAGKFLAAWLFFMVMLLPTVINPAIFYYFHPFDLGPLVAAYLGLILLASAFIACGMFVSSLTENQVVSAMVTYGILVFFWFLTWNEEATNEYLLTLLLGLSLFDHFYNFTRGVIDTRDVVFFVTFVAVFLFFTLLSLAARKWRGVR
jgi:ABC-2 type transport system permease protein